MAALHLPCLRNLTPTAGASLSGDQVFLSLRDENAAWGNDPFSVMSAAEARRLSAELIAAAREVEAATAAVEAARQAA